MATNEIPLARDLNTDAFDLAVKGTPIVGVDKSTHGTSYYITTGPKSKNATENQRRFQIHGCKFPYDIKPSNVPKSALPGPDGVLPKGSFQAWDRLSLCVELDPAVHEADVDALTRVDKRLVDVMFARKADLFTNASYITDTTYINVQYKHRLVRLAQGATPPQMWPDIVGWGSAIENAAVLQWTTTLPTGAKKTESRIKSCTYAPRAVDFKPPANSSKPTIFRVNLGDGKWTDRVPLRADGSFDNYDSPVLLDDKRQPRMRLVGPGDLTPGSSGIVYFDPTEIKIDKSITRGLNALIVQFDRAIPKTGTFGLAPSDEAEEDDNRASMTDVQSYFEQQEAEARARVGKPKEPSQAYASGSTSLLAQEFTPVSIPQAQSSPPGAPKKKTPKVSRITIPPPSPPKPLHIVDEEAEEDEDDEDEIEDADLVEAAVKAEKTLTPLPVKSLAGQKRRAEEPLLTEPAIEKKMGKAKSAPKPVQHA